MSKGKRNYKKRNNSLKIFFKLLKRAFQGINHPFELQASTRYQIRCEGQSMWVHTDANSNIIESTMVNGAFFVESSS